jgi:protein gp37
MTDIFGEWVPDALLDRLFAVFALRPDVTWQVLTKRAERMRDYMLVMPARRAILPRRSFAPIRWAAA